ncbi:dockerin type I repeat-containing protein [Engelhardtia mirabilis]|uniref:dockerin type I domain-containing protein n=1 Tax=Engelhardtia mirabilis TaxID=2528011 RepID=UPI0011A27E19
MTASTLGLAAASVTAQECVNDLLAAQPSEYLTGCDLAASTCDLGGFTKFRVAGGGYELQGKIEELALFPPFPQTEHWVIEVGPDLEPAPGVVEVYDPLIIYSDSFPFGLTLVSKWGPDTATIDGGGVQPAIYVDNFSFSGGPLRIGLATASLDPGAGVDDLLPPADYEGWHGFTITGGVADNILLTVEDGGGIHVPGYGSRLDIVGNVVTGNAARETGGGIYLRDVSQGVVALNEIEGNTAGAFGNYAGNPLRGGGVHQLRGCVDYVANIVHGNDFGEQMLFLEPEPPRQGGGVAATLTGGGFVELAQLCGNYVHHNAAEEGGGVWIELFTNGGHSQGHLQQNISAANESWSPSDNPKGISIDEAYRGGGVWIRARSSSGGLIDHGGEGPIVVGGFFAHSSTTSPAPGGVATVPFPDNSISATLFDNRLLDNTVANPGFTTSVVDDVGGGLYCDVERNDDSDRVSLFGNAAIRNTVPDAGGGFYLDNPSTFTPPVTGELFHNTLAWNDVTGAAGDGSGVHFTAPTRFDGSSNIIFHNRIAGVEGNDDNWFGEPGVVDDLRFTQMTLVVPPGSADLIGVANDDAAPLLLPSDYHLADGFSPVIDEAEDGITLFLGVDLDFHPRVIDRFILGTSTGADRGADEFIAFRRGDVNADGCFDISDPSYLLNALFVPGSPSLPCPAAADINNDGPINIADAIFMLAYLFSGGAPPPEFGLCLTEDVGPTPQPIGLGTPCDCP